MFDSVFSSILDLQNSEDPYASDEPILGRNEIDKSLNDTEENFTTLINAVGWKETDKYLKKIEPALEKGDRAFIEKESWNIKVPMQGLLYALWKETWSLGCNHAVKEINIALFNSISSSINNQKSSFKTPNTDIILFRQKDEPVYIAYPPDYGIPLSRTNLQQAVEQRTLKLANDVSDQTRDRIQSYVLDAIDKHKESGGVPLKERKLLVRRINGIFGRQAQSEVMEGLAPEERVKTRVSIPGTNSFHKRARLIAATELSAAYSLARLQVYVQADIKKVRWQAMGDLKTCFLCRSRNGTVHEIKELLAQHQFASKHIYDPSQYIIPAHPGDRCHWQPLLEEIDDEDKKKSKEHGRNPRLRQIVQLSRAWSLVGTSIKLARGIKKIQENKQRQKRSDQQKLLTNLFLTGGIAALSLSALYLLLRKQEGTVKQGTTIQTPSPLQVNNVSVEDSLKEKIQENIKETLQETVNKLQQQENQRRSSAIEATPTKVLTLQLKQKYPNLAKENINLAAVTDSFLTTVYLVKPQDVKTIRSLVEKYQRFSSIPIERALVPQNLLPQNILQKYPQLNKVTDARNLSVAELVRLGVSPNAAPRIEKIIQQSIRDRLALPPAKNIDDNKLMVGDVNLNTASPQEIANLLSSTSKRKQIVAQNIWKFLKKQQILGRPVTDLQDLRRVKGVGLITIRNLDAKNYNTNLNNLLLQLGDKMAARVIASQLEIGPKLANLIVKDFRSYGQFGRNGIEGAEDLISRLQSAIDASGSSLVLSLETKNRIREKLKGKLYLIPIPITQAQAQTASDIESGDLSPTNKNEKQESLSSLAPIRTPYSSSIPRIGPTRYQPPMRSTDPIIVTSQELRQQENRDRIMRSYQTVESLINSYQTSLTSTINKSKNSQSQKSTKLGTQISNALIKQQDAIEKHKTAIASFNINVISLNNRIPETEKRVKQIELLLENSNDPLAQPYFNNNGLRSYRVSKEIKSINEQINNDIKKIDYNLKIKQREELRLNNIKNNLQSFKSLALQALENINNTPSQLFLQRQECQQNLLRLLDELSSIRVSDVGNDFFNSIKQIQTLVNNLIHSLPDPRSADAITRIEGFLTNIDDTLSSMSSSQIEDNLSTLAQGRKKLIALQEKLKETNLPLQISDLPPDKEEEMRQAQKTRTRIQKMSANLNSSIESYRQRIDSQVEQIRVASNSEDLTSIIQELEVKNSDGLTMHQQERNQAISSNNSLIASNLALLDNNLNQLRMVTGPSGIQYVMQNIPEVLEDEKSNITGGISTERKKAPRGLDEAATIRRLAIKSLRDQLDYKGEPGKIKSGNINTLENILDYDSPNLLTKQRLSRVEEQIAKWESMRNQSAINISRYASKVRSDLNALRESDPVAYSEIFPQKIIQEIEYNTAFQSLGFEKRITRLRKLRSALIKELETPISYSDQNSKSVPASVLRSNLLQARNEVRSLGVTRRNDLDMVWREVVNAGADAASLAESIKKNKSRTSSGIQGSHLTPNQKKLLSKLSDAQVQTLIDSVESGAFDLYRQLGALSGQKIKLEELANQKWQQIQKNIRELEVKYGYTIKVRMNSDGSIFLSDLEDIETNPDRFKRRRPSPERLLAVIRQLSGADLTGSANLNNPRNYLEIQEALRQNMQLRQSIDHRLELLNFNQKLWLTSFKKVFKPTLDFRTFGIGR